MVIFRLIKQSFSMISVRMINAVIALLVVIVSANQLGPAEYGLYSLVLSIFTLLAIPIKNGASILTIREIKVKDKNNRDIYALQALYMYIFILSSFVSVCLFWLFDVFDNSKLNYIALLFSALFYAAGQSIISISRTEFIVEEKYIKSQLPEMIYLPLLMLTIIYLLNIRYGENLLIVNSASSLLIGFVLFKTLNISLPGIFNSLSLIRKDSNSKWMISSLSISAISGLQLLNSQVDIYSLAALSTVESVGVYKVASQFSSFLFIPVVSISIFISPKILKLIASDKKREAKSIFFISGAIGIVSSFILFLVVYYLHPLIIDKVLGDKYSTVGEPLVVLCFGAVLLSIFGPILGVANMMNLEKHALLSSIFSIILNLLINYHLVPLYGAAGAAFSTVLSMFIWKVLLSFFVIKNWRVK